jgi:hypothetical protein
MEKRSEVEVQSYQARVSKLQSELDHSVNDMKVLSSAEIKGAKSISATFDRV